MSTKRILVSIVIFVICMLAFIALDMVKPSHEIHWGMNILMAGIGSTITYVTGRR